ncbi:MAG: hypothetical protein MUF40_06900 [Gemmatimonadaceae bacterium]|nr:hypothetical protein [Gemmatimonadaceae bacterium]
MSAGVLAPGPARRRAAVHLAVFGATLLTWMLVYARATVGSVGVTGPGNRGDIGLGDVLWCVLALATAFILALRWRAVRIPVALPVGGWMAVPYLAGAVLLPVIGVVVADWPPSYAAPAVRQLQWCAFAVFTVALAWRVGAERVWTLLRTLVVVCAVSHALYAAIQLLFAVGLVGQAWVWLDDAYRARSTLSWFFYPRLTGLLVNPNSYGLFSVFAVVLLVADAVAGRAASGPWRTVGLVAAAAGIAGSGSRSALVGITAALLVMSAVALAHRASRRRFAAWALRGALAGGLLFAVLLPAVPPAMWQRFVRLWLVLLTGTGADVDAAARTRMWSDLWTRYVTEHPFGTLVPASYATGSEVDSFYVVTTVQGTPLWTLAFIVHLIGIVLLGAHVARRGTALDRAVGFTLAGWAAILALASITLQAMLEPGLVAPLWAVVGLALWRLLAPSSSPDASPVSA